MASENEPAKLLLPYLQRADELQKHDPLVAYYLRLYAMERGLKIPQKERTKTTNALFVSLIKQLEKDKKSLTLGPDDHLHVEGFASNVFAKADKQDRAGKADINTAKTFYAASIFFEILNQFGEVQPDLEQKQKYAAWKAADIRKALKEGRKPLPGPPGGDEDLSVPSWTEQDLESSGRDSAVISDPSRVNPTATIQPDSDVSPQLYNKHDLQHSTNISPGPSNIVPTPSPNISTPHHYPTDGKPSDAYHQQPPANHSENSFYSHHQPYQSEPQPHVPQNYPSQNTYPNFQSYPSFTESSLPAAPSQYPSYYQGSDPSYSNLHPSYYQGLDASSYPSVPPAATTYSSSSHHDQPVARNGNVFEASPPPSAQKYEYDSSYEPPPEQIAEAHRAARFAVGALAFDDVFVAVDHLKKALELLTKPSAGH